MPKRFAIIAEDKVTDQGQTYSMKFQADELKPVLAKFYSMNGIQNNMSIIEVIDPYELQIIRKRS